MVTNYLGYIDFFETPLTAISDRAAFLSDMTREQYRKIEKSIYNAYTSSLLDGFNRYDPNVRGNYDLIDNIKKITGLKDTTIFNWLSAMYTLAQSGSIPVGVWSPVTEQEAKVKVEALMPKEETVTEKFLSPVTKTLTKATESAFNKILVAGTILGVLYFAAPPIIGAVTKRR